MSDIDAISKKIQEWQSVNTFCRPQVVTVDFDTYLRICNLPCWSTEKWAAMLKGERDLILFGLPIKHFGYGIRTKVIKVG